MDVSGCHAADYVSRSLLFAGAGISIPSCFDAGGVAAVAPVQVEFAAGDRMVIREGALRPGMRVVVEGNERIFPGQPLIELPDEAQSRERDREAGRTQEAG